MELRLPLAGNRLPGMLVTCLLVSSGVHSYPRAIQVLICNQQVIGSIPIAGSTCKSVNLKTLNGRLMNKRDFQNFGNFGSETAPQANPDGSTAFGTFGTFSSNFWFL